MQTLVPDDEVPIELLAIGMRRYTTQILEKKILIYIWDNFDNYNPKPVYYENANGMFLFFDLTNKESLVMLPEMLNKALKHQYPNPLRCVLIGNKSDLEKKIANQEISDTLKLLEHPGIGSIKYVEMSVSEDINVFRPIELLLPDLMVIEKLCFNCYKTSDSIELIEGLLFCPECANEPDLDKAQAFFRVHYK